MRVVHVINRYGWSGGAENQLSMNLGRFGNPELEHSVIALYADDDPESDRTDSGARVQFLSHEKDGVRRYELFQRLHRALDDLAPDLVHTSLAEASLGARLYGLRRRVRVLESLVNISHEPLRLVDNRQVTPWKLAAHRNLDRFTMRGVTHFHALSQAVADSWIETVGIDRTRITVIPRGVDTSVFRPSADKASRQRLLRELGLPDETKLVLTVGRQEPQKGHSYLIDSMRAVVEEIPEAILLMAGREGNSTEGIRRLIEDLDIGEKVVFLGVRDDIADLLTAADCFVFPSLFEGMGVSLLEAMASGAACVITDARPFDEMVVDGESALMVPKATSRPLAQAVVRVLTDSELANELGSAARMAAVSRFRIEDTAASMEALYLRLAQGARGRP